jgi:type I restriction-modification system DNA methylase subunit
MDNSKLITQINQLFHNKGVKQEERFNLLIELLESMKCTNTNIEKYKEIIDLLNLLDYNNKDLMQEIFMTIGSKYTKFNLDQFYTPLTISKFISSMMIQGEKAIDPAGGTGDLLLYYNGEKTIWDIDDNALKLCKLNYELNKQDHYNLVCKNSLYEIDDYCEKYSYVAMNPPFGTNTVITERHILDAFELGQNKKKQEIGILFLELGLKLLKEGGVLFIIVPSGYVGNKNNICSEMRDLILKHRLIASIELPENTFKRSGTGVNTYLLIIQKVNITTTPYNIFINSVNEIGYNLTKKNTPLKYKIFRHTGDVIMDENDKPILDNDLDDVCIKMREFCHDNKITGFNMGVEIASDPSCRLYEYISSNNLSGNIVDIKRYMKQYLDVVDKLEKSGSVKVSQLGKILNTSTKIEKNKKYKYIDIGEITSPLYSHKDLYGWELPSRAKYSVKKYDILVSKLEGTMSYCVILDDDKHYISTNGVAVIRPNDKDSLYILMSNIMKRDFAVQHRAFLTGSIMASLSDTDIGNILICNNGVDINTTKKILDTLETLQSFK